MELSLALFAIHYDHRTEKNSQEQLNHKIYKRSQTTASTFVSIEVQFENMAN